MSRSNIFKIFCFLAATLLFTNIVLDLRLTETPYLKIITQFGLMIFLTDIGLHANKHKELKDSSQNTTTSNYSFLVSKFGLGSALVGFLLQTLSI